MLRAFYNDRIHTRARARDVYTCLFYRRPFPLFIARIVPTTLFITSFAGATQRVACCEINIT